MVCLVIHVVQLRNDSIYLRPVFQRLFRGIANPLWRSEFFKKGSIGSQGNRCPVYPQSLLIRESRGFRIIRKDGGESRFFEPFHNPITRAEVWDCVIKLGEVSRQLQREANRSQTRIPESELPKLWMLTPTASTAILSKFGGRIDRSWMAGVYFLPEWFRSAIVVIHQLPRKY